MAIVAESPKLEASVSEGANHVNTVVGNGEVLLMARAVPVRAPHAQTKEEVMVLFDQGSQASFITEELASRLGLPRVSAAKPLQVSGFQGTKPISFRSTRYLVKLRLEGGGYVEMVLNGTPFITTPLRPTPAGQVNENSDKEEIEAQVRRIREGTETKPEILLGMPDFWQVFQAVKEVGVGLYLVQTTVGSMLCGRSQAEALEADFGPAAAMVAVVHPPNRDHLPPVQDVEQFWSLEGIGVHENPPERPVEIATELFKQTVRRVEDGEEKGRYVVGWPWKDECPDLPTNFRLCHARLGSVWRRLMRDQPLLTAYDAYFQNQLEVKFIEDVPEKQLAPREGVRVYYFPHQPIITTKMRVVDDASASESGCNSLNDCLYRGEIRMANLVGLLIRFRMAPVAVLAYIEKAFLQLVLEPKDRDVTRFLWVTSGSLPLPTTCERSGSKESPSGSCPVPFCYKRWCDTT